MQPNEKTVQRAFIKNPFFLFLILEKNASQNSTFLPLQLALTFFTNQMHLTFITRLSDWQLVGKMVELDWPNKFALIEG